MNPNSNYYLAINTGFPNAYDRANGRTGAFLMIHGDCSSAGCYAMTDEQIAEIYTLARESFFGGQKSFQIQAYPFRMTPLNIARHRNSPHVAFWKMLKQGYDHFEVTRREPKVEVCEKRYVFDAEASAKFSPADRCPAYKVPEEIASAAPASSGGVGGFFSKFFGSKSEDQGTAATASQTSETSPSKSKRAAAAKPGQSAAAAPRPKLEQPAEAKASSTAKASASKEETNGEPQRNTATTTGALNGAAPTVPSGGFEGRFGAWN